MKTFAYILLAGSAIIAAFGAEQLASGVTAGRIFTPPFIILAMLGWFLILSLPGRLWLGGSAGFMLDTLGASPFGTYMLLGLVLAVLAHFPGRLFSHRDSNIAKATAFAVLAAAAFLFIPAARQALFYIKGIGI